MIKNILFALLVTLGTSSVINAATLTFNPSSTKTEVTGITGVSVDGKTYWASFVKESFVDGKYVIGSYEDFYDSSPFEAPLAEKLNDALQTKLVAYHNLSNLYLDQFDIAGCAASQTCIIMTPTTSTNTSSFRAYVNQVSVNSLGSYAALDHINRPINLDFYAGKTFAVWKEGNAPSAVPVPAAAFMFAPALLGLLGLRRRKRAA